MSGEGPGPAGESDLDVRYYASVLWRGRWLIVVAVVLGVALSSLVAYLQIPEYQAQALVQIEPPVPFFMGVNDALMGGGGYWQNSDFYNTQFRIITSKAIAVPEFGHHRGTRRCHCCLQVHVESPHRGKERWVRQIEHQHASSRDALKTSI